MKNGKWPMANEPLSKIALSAGSLRVMGDLQRADLAAFKESFANLCDSEQQSVYVDLGRCTHMSSMFIGELAEVVMKMTAAGKDVRVDVSPELGKVLHMARLYHLFDYEITSEIA